MVNAALGATLGAITEVQEQAKPLSTIVKSECHTISMYPDVQVTGLGRVLPDVLSSSGAAVV